MAGWVLLSVLVIPAVLVPAGFLGRRLGTAYINDIAGVTRGQAGELLQVLVSQSEGELSPERLVQLSSTMAALEERTMHQTQGITAIREIALIDKKGKILAHNDVTRMAKNAVSRFTDEKYTKISQRIRRDSIAITAQEAYNPELPANPVARRVSEALIPHLKKEFPELFIATYEATAAVYPVDGEIPSGGVVMVLENRAPLRVFGAIGSVLSPAALAALGAIMLVLFLYLPVLLLLSARKKDPAPATMPREIETLPAVEAEPEAIEPVSDDPDFHAPEMPAVDFGEVPLPDFIDPVHSYAAAAASVSPSVSHSVSVEPALASRHDTGRRHHSFDEILDAIPVEPD